MRKRVIDAARPQPRAPSAHVGLARVGAGPSLPKMLRTCQDALRELALRGGGERVLLERDGAVGGGPPRRSPIRGRVARA